MQTEPNPPYRLKFALGLLIAGTVGVLLIVVAINLFTALTDYFSSPDAPATAKRPETPQAPERPRPPKKIVAPSISPPKRMPDPPVPPTIKTAEAKTELRTEAPILEHRSEPPKLEQPPIELAQKETAIPLDRQPAAGKAPPLLGVDTKGAPVDLDDYKGKVVLVDFWASWCDPYVRNLPRLKEAYAKYHASGLEIVGVCLNDDPIWMSNFTRKNEMTWRQIQASDGYDSPLVVRWKVTDLPAAYLIGKNGMISRTAVTGKDLARLIEAELKK